MKRLFALAFALSLLPAAAFAQSPAAVAPVASPAPAGSPIDLPPENPAVTKIAFQQFVAWQAGIIKRGLYSTHVQEQMTDTVIQETSKQLGSLGPLLTAKYVGPVMNDSAPTDSANYLYLMECQRGSVYMQFAILHDGKIGGIVFRNSPP